ncbi:hypothetical protein HHI36_006372 [Cryptolaemus montrouzieri]|uniref:Uncharacterized protein n=1 Tax=Cryptolaemus montrouzieri TaxID=559131 RepID=A0ABD2NXS8_9CUCU
MGPECEWRPELRKMSSLENELGEKGYGVAHLRKKEENKKTDEYESYLEEMMKRFSELKDFCEHNKNVHTPIKSMIGKTRCIMKKMRQGVSNEDNTNSEDKIQEIITENITLGRKNVELQRIISASRKKKN